MEDVIDTAQVAAPWWLDGLEDDDPFAVSDEWDDGVEAAPVSVPEAIALLASLAGRHMSEEQRLSVVELWQPQLAWAAGAEQAAIAALAGPAPATKAEWDNDVEAFELAPALRSTVEHAKRRIGQARLLSGAFSATGDLLRAGGLDPYRVWLMLETLTTLPVELARQVEAELLPVAASMTGSRLRRTFAQKRTTRRVSFAPTPRLA